MTVKTPSKGHRRAVPQGWMHLWGWWPCGGPWAAGWQGWTHTGAPEDRGGLARLCQSHSDPGGELGKCAHADRGSTGAQLVERGADRTGGGGGRRTHTRSAQGAQETICRTLGRCQASTHDRT